MVNRAPWACYKQENYTLLMASCWMLPIDYSFIKTQVPFQLFINKRVAVKYNSFENTGVQGDEILSQTWRWPVFTVNIIPHLNLEMKQGWGKKSRFRSELPADRGELCCQGLLESSCCLLSQKTSTFFGSLCMCFRLGGGKVHLHRHLRLTHKCYSPATCLWRRRRRSSSLRPKKQPQITLKWKGWVRFKLMYPVVCIKKQHQLEGISLSWKSGKTFMTVNWSGCFLNAKAQR